VHGSLRRDTLRLMDHPNHNEIMRRILSEMVLCTTLPEMKDEEVHKG
jgi:hypothetical protein